MLFTYQNNAVELYDAGGKKVAEVVFPNVDENTVNIERTFVDASLRGQGVAPKLLEAAAKQIRAKNKKAVLTCSYAKKWFGEHPEYQDIL